MLEGLIISYGYNVIGNDKRDMQLKTITDVILLTGTRVFVRVKGNIFTRYNQQNGSNSMFVQFSEGTHLPENDSDIVNL